MYCCQKNRVLKPTPHLQYLAPFKILYVNIYEVQA